VTPQKYKLKRFLGERGRRRLPCSSRMDGWMAVEYILLLTVKSISEATQAARPAGIAMWEREAAQWEVEEVRAAYWRRRAFAGSTNAKSWGSPLDNASIMQA
jgi:hypothetical protein